MLAAIVVAGLASRSVQTGFVLIDKYLGDALYAAMIYSGLRVLGVRGRVGVLAMAIMVAIECFQLTGIPAWMYRPEQPLGVRVVGRLLGTEFAWLDLVAYAAGILAVAVTAPWLDRRQRM